MWKEEALEKGTNAAKRKVTKEGVANVWKSKPQSKHGGRNINHE